jgi:hypothetical protein
MKRILAILMAAMTTMSFAPHAAFEPESGGHIVLPNKKLMLCKSSSCSQLYSEGGPHDIYPRQVRVDFFGSAGSEGCLRGVSAVYEKSVPIDDLKAAIDQRYAKWAYANNPKLWRVEPQKFAIQLGVTEDRTKGATHEQKRARALGQLDGYGDRSNVAEAGMPEVIYIAFAESKCNFE